MADDAAALACELRQRIRSKRDPFAPAVKSVVGVPEPSLAVFAAAGRALPIFGVNPKTGVVFAVITYLLIKMSVLLVQGGRDQNLRQPIPD